MESNVDRYPVLREMERVALFRDLGYRFTDAGEGAAEITFTATERTENLYGIVHGGVWLVLADSAMGGALGTVADGGVQVITGQLDFRWLRPLEGETIVARARVLRRGRTLSHCTAELFDAAGRQIGLATGTYVLVAPD